MSGTFLTSANIKADSSYNAIFYAGTHYYRVPFGVTSISIIAIGAGGGGGGGYFVSLLDQGVGGGGGGGGLAFQNTVSVTPGEILTIVVGQGGAGGLGTKASYSLGPITSGANGGDSYVARADGTIIVRAEGGRGGGAGYVQPQTNIVRIGSTNVYDATALGPLISIDGILADPSSSILPTTGYLIYFLITGAVSIQQMYVSFRKDIVAGVTILSQSAFTIDSITSQVAYTASTNALINTANDDHDTLFMNGNGLGVIHMGNNRILGNSFISGYANFRGSVNTVSSNSLANSLYWGTAVFNHITSNSYGTIISFPAVNGEVVINFTSGTYRVGGGVTADATTKSLPNPMSPLIGSFVENTIFTISDGVNQFLIGKHGQSECYVCTVLYEYSTIQVHSINLWDTSDGLNDFTEEDAIGDQLFALDGFTTFNKNATFYYSGTRGWKAQSNVFSNTGKLTMTAGSIDTQTGMDIWGSIDTSGYVWFADWGHDDGGLFNILPADQYLGTRRTNIQLLNSNTVNNERTALGGRGGIRLVGEGGSEGGNGGDGVYKKTVTALGSRSAPGGGGAAGYENKGGNGSNGDITGTTTLVPHLGPLLSNGGGSEGFGGGGAGGNVNGSLTSTDYFSNIAYQTIGGQGGGVVPFGQRLNGPRRPDNSPPQPGAAGYPGSFIGTGVSTWSTSTVQTPIYFGSFYDGFWQNISTTPTAGSNDDGYWAFTLPWFHVWQLGNTFTAHNRFFVSTNSYITFNAGYTTPSVSGSSPPVDKIYIQAADNSCQQIKWSILDGLGVGKRQYKVRFEGTAARTGVLGSPNMIWEVTFYEEFPRRLELQFGTIARTGGFNGYFSSSALINGFSTGIPVAGSGELRDSPFTENIQFFNYGGISGNIAFGGGGGGGSSIMNNSLLGLTAGTGTNGLVRLVWPGNTRLFPDVDVGPG